MLREHEGLRLEPYRCTAGKLTIGYGRNLDDVGITKQEAEYMLNNDVISVAGRLEEALPYWDTLSPVRKAVLVDMGFNLGVPGLLKFKKTLEAVENREWEKAGEEMLNSRWATQVGTRAKRLKYMMVTGEWCYF